MSLQSYIYSPIKFICDDNINNFGPANSSLITVPFNTALALPTGPRSVQRSFTQFVLAPGNQGWFRGIAFKGINAANITGSSFGLRSQPNFSVFSNTRVRAAIMDTDSATWLDSTSNTGLPRNVLASMTLGHTWAQAANNASPTSGSLALTMYAFPFDVPVYLYPGSYWIQMLVEFIYPTNGAGAFSVSAEWPSPLIVGSNTLPYLNTVLGSNFLTSAYEGDNFLTGINQLLMVTNLNTNQTYSTTNIQANVTTGSSGSGGTNTLFGQIFVNLTTTGLGQNYWTPYLWGS